MRVVWCCISRHHHRQHGGRSERQMSTSTVRPTQGAVTTSAGPVRVSGSTIGDRSECGTYALAVRVANIGTGARFHMEIDGIDRTGPLEHAKHGGVADVADGEHDRAVALCGCACDPACVRWRHGRERGLRQLQLVAVRVELRWLRTYGVVRALFDVPGPGARPRAGGDYKHVMP